MRIDGKKLNLVCVLAIIANTVLYFIGADIFAVFYAVSVELFLAIMAGRSTARKLDEKLQSIKQISRLSRV